MERWCTDNGVTFAHLDDWPGYKSGALNYALHNLVDERAELVGVVDADYRLDPDFLMRCAPLFADPQVGFVQAPQDYREWEHAPFFRRLYYSYLYFFAVSQPSRNERDGAIFAGTMGLIRRPMSAPATPPGSPSSELSSPSPSPTPSATSSPTASPTAVVTSSP